MDRTNLDVTWPRGEIEVTVSNARSTLPELIDQVRDGSTVYLSRYGKRVAALVPVDAAAYLEKVEDEYWSKRADEVMSSDPQFVPLDEAIADWEAQDAER
ncbi:type II toxin-antitoxin system Phd/YefM family antitoxin [Amycolatopsis anabasis]|uniref:type II toxin-antitoxin system Phd/YefM family antitoxin n=1 Tax=Amycolatopsis anabasis TaxID=1840409 RepID=UPI00131C19D8|nr:type II toxin-antitoxin system prevent-host-death family antitoxin [Amycolatopsis anabasis]